MKQILNGALCLSLLIGWAPARAHDSADLDARASAAYESGDFATAGVLYMEIVENGWGETRAVFNAACSFALAGNPEAAFGALDAALELGFGKAEQLSGDADLESLRADPRWEGLLERCAGNAQRQLRFWDNPVWHTEYREDITMAEKVAGLSRLWSGAKYGFVNFDLVPDLDWDRSYFESLDRVMAAGSTFEYYRVLQLMCVQLKDGHTYVTPPKELRSRLWSRPPIRTRLVEGRVMVVDVYGDTAQRFGVKPGDELLEVDGMPVLEYSRSYVRPYQFASTPQDLDTKAYETRLLAGAEGSKVALRLAREDGSSYECELERMWGKARSELVPTPEPMTHAWVNGEGGIALVTLNTFNDPVTAERFEAQFDALSVAKAIIIDIRENGGGNSSVGWRVLKLLTSESFSSSMWYTRSYRPVFREWRRPEGRYARAASVITPDGKRVFNGPVVVLTSPRTYSAAEDFCLSFRSVERGLIIGEPTGGSTGQPLRLRLPGGLIASVCSKRDRFPDGTEFVGVGIQPDLLVSPSVADIRAGRDTVLKAAIAEVSKRIE
jgi:carboxyl-terminal processing protease